jgi:putative aldouronate transport system substrate-binding protein
VVLSPPTGPDGKSSVGVDLTNVRIFAVSKQAKDAGKGEAIARLLAEMDVLVHHLLQLLYALDPIILDGVGGEFVV